MTGNRVSKIVVQEILEKYLTEDLVANIICDIVEADEKEDRSEVGMLYGEWKKRFDDPHSVVWAADSGAGFGRKGWTVYGDCDDMRIVEVVHHQCGEKELRLWYDGRNDWKEVSR